MTSTILILTGGGPAPTTPLPGTDLVIAADSGLGLAEALGVQVDLVVGDLDSVDRSQLDAAVTAGATVEEHPTDKDATDLDLALQAAVDRGGTRIVIAGGGAGRLDHLLGIAMLLTDDRWSDIAIEWHSGWSVTHIVRGDLALDTLPEDIVSVVPVSNEVVISIAGTRWSLEAAPLTRGTTHGISNEALGDSIEIKVHQGVVFVVITRGE